MNFPEDDRCHDAGMLGGPCLAEPAYTLSVAGGGMVARLCESHFDAQLSRWTAQARRNAVWWHLDSMGNKAPLQECRYDICASLAALQSEAPGA